MMRDDKRLRKMMSDRREKRGVRRAGQGEEERRKEKRRRGESVKERGGERIERQGEGREERGEQRRWWFVLSEQKICLRIYLPGFPERKNVVRVLFGTLG